MKSRAFARYSAIACILAMVGCSSSDDTTDTDAGVEAGGSVESGGAEGGTPEAGADVVAPDVSNEATADAAPEAAADVRQDQNVTPADVAVEARVEASVVEAGASEASIDARADALVEAGPGEASADAQAEAEPEASVTEEAGESADAAEQPYIRPGCTAPTFPAIVRPTSSTILDMEGSGVSTQAVTDGPGNWNEPDVEPLSPDGGVRNPTGVYALLSPARDTSLHGIHSFGSGYQYPGVVVVGLLGEFLQPLDATQYPGITFYAKGSTSTTTLSVEAGLTSTLEQYCRCDPGGNGAPSRCNDNPSTDVALTTAWQKYTLTWAQFVQSGYGNKVPTDPSQLLNFVFRANPPTTGAAGTWDFWLDDISFTTP